MSLLALLGQGGMGRVYRARHEPLGRDVAVKILSAGRADEALLRRFTREARILSRIDHPNAVRVFDFGVDGPEQLPFLIMELVEGRTIASILDEEGPFRLLRALRVTLEIAKVLVDAHALGVVHRDLKPANVMLEPLEDPGEERVRVLDFGLAKLLTQEHDGDDRSLTQQGMVVGTPAYMAPEQAAGDRLDVRVDVYALGATLYRILSGAPPFRAPTPQAVLALHIAPDARPVSLREIVPALDQEASTLVDAMLEKQAADRPNAEEVRDRLARLLDRLGADDDLRFPIPSAGPDRTALDLFGSFTPSERPRTRRLEVRHQEEASRTLPAYARVVREWTLLEELGRGGSGVVFRAEHRLLPGAFAVKVLRADQGADPELRHRFIREASVLQSLKHPNIVASMPPFEVESLIYLPMELLVGDTLRDWAPERRPLAPEEALEIIRQASEAVGYAHVRGLIHRDLKPSNLFVLASGAGACSVKVLDFGLARAGRDASITKSGALLGTPAYMAPEVLRGEEATARTDVYALGLILYELIAGRLPFELPAAADGSVWPILAAVQRAHERGLAPLSTRAAVSPSLGQLVDRSLSVRPSDRPRDGVELAELIRVELSGDARVALTGADSTTAPIAAERGGQWIKCPHCSLKHRERPDAKCPGCQRSTAAAAPPPADRAGRWKLSVLSLALVLAISAIAYLTTSSPAPATRGSPASTPREIAGVELQATAQTSSTSVARQQPRPPEEPVLSASPSISEGQRALARAEAEAYLLQLFRAERAFRSEYDFYVEIAPSGPGKLPKAPFEVTPCPAACSRHSPARCDSAACIGFKPSTWVTYRYACQTLTAGPESEVTCAAAADLDGNGKSKMFVIGSADGVGATTIQAPIPALGELGRCAVGKTPPGEVIDCDPEEW